MSKRFDLGLVRTETGVPVGGDVGQVLTKLADGWCGWADITLRSITTSATNAEIEAQLAANKFCYLHSGNNYLPLIWRKNATDHYFGGYVYDIGASKPRMVTYRCHDNDWTSDSRDDGAFLNSPVFTGTPAAPTAATGTNTTQLATTAFVQQEIADKQDVIEAEGVLKGNGGGSIEAVPLITSTQIDDIVDTVAYGIGGVDNPPVLVTVQLISSAQIDTIINSVS